MFTLPSIWFETPARPVRQKQNPRVPGGDEGSNTNHAAVFVCIGKYRGQSNRESGYVNQDAGRIR
ncbi:MAG TPA: hypothetical protein VL051_00300, partial [Burkholderiaceae bacterium]|nr:hypothetical protein [Burkholderiaceae bacterium]